MNNLELVRDRLDELGVQYDEECDGMETTFFLDYNEQCDSYMNTISVVGECVTFSQHYLHPYVAVFLATFKGGCEHANA